MGGGRQGRELPLTHWGCRRSRLQSALLQLLSTLASDDRYARVARMGWEGARALQLKACPWLAALSWRATLGYASMAKVDQMAVEAKVMEVTANAVVYLRFRMDSLHSRSSTTAGRAWQSLADAASFLGQRLPACLSAPVPRDGRLVMCSGWQGPCPCAAVAVLHAIQRGAAVVWKHSSADQAFEESPRCERRPAGGGGVWRRWRAQCLVASCSMVLSTRVSWATPTRFGVSPTRPALGSRRGGGSMHRRPETRGLADPRPAARGTVRRQAPSV